MIAKTPPHRGGVFVHPEFTWFRDLALSAIALSACLATFLLLRPALDGPFVFDDLSNISHLSLIDGKITLEHLGSYLYSFSGSLGRPLSALSFLINDSAWPTDPRPFKYTNLLLHLINGLLIFLLVVRLTRDLPPNKAQFISVLTTVTWLIAPLQVASVMLTVQRMALLSAFFTLAGLVLHIRSVQTPKPLTGTQTFLVLTRLGLFTFLAFLCKENGALVPLFAVCLHATLLRPYISSMGKAPRILLVYGSAAPWMAIVAYLAINPAYVTGGYGSGREFTLGERVLTEARVLWDYLEAIWLPRIGGHSVFHDDYVLSHSLLDPLTTLPAALGWVLIVGFAISSRKTSPWLAFAALWFLAAHAMESTVISLEIYFEHRNYLAMLGPLLLLSIALAKLEIRLSIPLFALWIGIAGFATFSNAKVWSNRAIMADVWLAEHPNSVRAIQLKAGVLSSTGDVREAIQLLEDSYASLPKYGELYFQTLPLRCAIGSMTAEHLVQYIDAAKSVRTPQIPANQLPDLRMVASQCGKAYTISDWWKISDALLTNPHMRVSKNALAHIHYQRAQAAVSAGDLNRAMLELDRSYAAEPNPFIPREQAVYLASAGLFEDALRYLDKSDSTPVSFWKRLTFDAEAMNSSLRSGILNITSKRERSQADSPR